MDFTRNRHSELILLYDELTIGERLDFISDIRGKLASGEARVLVRRLKAEGGVVEGSLYQDHKVTSRLLADPVRRRTDRRQMPRQYVCAGSRRLRKARSVPHPCGECSPPARGTAEHRNWDASSVVARTIRHGAMGPPARRGNSVECGPQR